MGEFEYACFIPGGSLQKLEIAVGPAAMASVSYVPETAALLQSDHRGLPTLHWLQSQNVLYFSNWILLLDEVERQGGDIIICHLFQLEDALNSLGKMQGIL